MQTTIDYVFEQLEENSLFFRGTDNELNISISASDYLDLKRLAKEMERQKIIDAYEQGSYDEIFAYDGTRKYKNGVEYYTSTYGSKGSETKQ